MTDDAALPPAEPPTDPIVIADDFAADVRVDRERDYKLRWQAKRDAHVRALARIWAPVVAVFFLGLFAMIAFLCFQTTSSHARVKVEQERSDRDKVTVWCYADPNNGGQSTSQFQGSRQNVAGICPDSHELG